MRMAPKAVGSGEHDVIRARVTAPRDTERETGALRRKLLSAPRAVKLTTAGGSVTMTASTGAIDSDALSERETRWP